MALKNGERISKSIKGCGKKCWSVDVLLLCAFSAPTISNTANFKPNPTNFWSWSASCDSEICHKHHGSHPGMWNGEELGKESWQSVQVVTCELFHQVTRLFEETDYIITLLSSSAT